MKKRIPSLQPNGFRPNVETLENRMQPGTVLGLGAVGLDLAANALPDANASDTALVSPLSLRRVDSSLHTGRVDQGTVVASTAPATGTASTPAPVATPNATPVQDQLRAVNSLAAVGFLGGNTSQNGLHEQVASVAATATPVGAPVFAASATPVLNTSIIATATNNNGGNGGIHSFDVSPVYISFNGTADGPSTTNSVRGLADLSAVTGGTVTDPATGGTDGLIAVISPDGSTRASVTLASGAGDSITVNAVDVSATDNAIYFAGNDTAADGSTTQVILGRVGASGSLDWALNITNPNGTSDRATGLRVYGNTLYVTGGLDQSLGTRGTTSDLLVGRIDNLSATPPTATDVTYLGTLGFTDADGNAVATVGKSIAADSSSPAGRAWFGGSLTLADGSDTDALFGTLDATGNDIHVAAFAPNAGETGAGSENSVDVLPDGSAAFAGQLNLPLAAQGSQGLATLLVSRFIWDGTTFVSQYSIQGQAADGIFHYLVDASQQQAAAWIPGGNRGIDATGAQAINTTAVDPATGLGGQILFRLDGTGANSLDANLIGVPGGSNDDQGLGLDVNGADYFLVGKTNSDDFLTTPNAFQPDSPFPGDYNGWVAHLNIT